MGLLFSTVFLPLTLLASATAIFRFTSADIAISSHYYAGPILGWPLKDAQPWKGLYDTGCWPAWVVALGGLAVVLLSLCWSRLRTWREPALFLALFLAIGPGLLVNLALKEQWGRPRPVQTKQFDGNYTFLPVGNQGSNRRECKSFPCGHASMGFYFMAPAFLLYRRRPRLAAVFLLLGLTYGGVMGYARIVQGRHFASDVIWSAAVVYFSGLAMAFVYHKVRPSGAGNSPDIVAIERSRGKPRKDAARTPDLQRAA
jgi:membrane-associated PAP2 superfamily phosphatase